jgi:hypothetical protein
MLKIMYLCYRFLNIHWFLDKLSLSGTRAQWINGIILLASFFFLRIILGSYLSFVFYRETTKVGHLLGPGLRNWYLAASFILTCEFRLEQKRTRTTVADHC